MARGPVYVNEIAPGQKIAGTVRICEGCDRAFIARLNQYACSGRCRKRSERKREKPDV